MNCYAYGLYTPIAKIKIHVITSNLEKITFPTPAQRFKYSLLSVMQILKVKILQ